MTILVVDDISSNRLLPAAILRKLGHAVLEAASGAEALALADAQPSVSHVLLDISMPGMSGIEVCQALRARAGGASLRIVAYTAHAFDHEHDEIRAAGFDMILVKPVSRAVLVAALGLEGSEPGR